MACKNSLTILTRFVKQHLHGGMPDSIDVEGLKKEVEELRQKNSDLESQVAQLQAEVCPFYYCNNYVVIFYVSCSLQKSQRDQMWVLMR